ncbi:MAG: electron transport complex subunit RsxC, partial [Pseudomonadales bacterium]|nr:electron transport complex subunit RsxC [Pseudomonadales bacterium]
GYESKAVIIETDGKDQALPAHPPLNPYTLDRKKLASKVAEGGIVGLGGATFPTALKLHSAANQNIHTLIINGGECEPYLTADDRLMRERPVPIIEGARLLQYIVNADRIAIVVEDNKPEAVKALQSAANQYADVEVIKVPTRYPMGSSKQMIQVVTGQEVPAGRQSTEVGVLLYNVATAYATYYCLMENQPLVSRIVTVSGGAITEPQNVEALIGTPLSYLIEQCGGTNTTPARLLMGGPMMGQIMPTDEAPLIKGAGGILALKQDEINNTESSPCIRCSRCVGACPMGLMPLEMANHTRNNDFEGAVEYGLKDCILCGSCAYVCPSHIPLVHYFQFAKGEISQQKAIQHRTQYTRDLSDAKRIRKEQEAAEKAAAKAKRRRKPATSDQ